MRRRGSDPARRVVVRLGFAILILLIALRLAKAFWGEHSPHCAVFDPGCTSKPLDPWTLVAAAAVAAVILAAWAYWEFKAWRYRRREEN
jgi:preprotein translocase subunit Sec61beta